MQHTNPGQRVVYPLPYFFCGNAEIFRAKAHVLFHYIKNNLVVWVLKHHTDPLADLPYHSGFRSVNVVHIDGSRLRNQQCIDMLCHRRLPGTIMPQDRRKIPRLYLKGDIIDGRFHCDHIIFRIPSYVVKCNMLRTNHCCLPLSIRYKGLS